SSEGAGLARRSTRRRLLRLAARQGWLEAVGVVAFGFVVPVVLPSLWPLNVLLIGVVFGVVVFAGERQDEQDSSHNDEWLTAGRVWLLKTCSWLLADILVSPAVMLGLLKAFPTYNGLLFSSPAIREIVDRVRFDRFVRDLGSWEMLALMVAYGFSAGQLGGLLLRSRLVAVSLGCVLAL